MNSSLEKPHINEKNIVKNLYKTSIYGKPHRANSVCQGNDFLLEKLSNPHNAEVEALHMAVKNLDVVLKPFRPDKKEAFKAFWDVKQQIIEIDGYEDDERNPKISEPIKWLKHQILEELAEILYRFVMSYTVFPFKVSHVQEKGGILQIRGVALELLHVVFVHFEKITQTFADDQKFLICLFTHLQFLETCFPASRVIECLLLCNRKILDLSSITYLKEMVLCLEDVTFGNFCKILSITLSELDMFEHRTSLYAQTMQKRTHNFFVRDINQDVVLKIPKILARLVDIACAKPYVPYFASAPMESAQWLKWIDTQIIEEKKELDIPDFIGGITEWDSVGVFGPNRSAMKIAYELTFRADAVCVLGLLLVGRHRREVQQELADLQLIPRLCDLFDHFVWRANIREHARLPGHNSTCECSPEVALKIQVLRLIHSFCDHSDFKHVMLSWCEYSEIQSLEGVSASTIPPPFVSRSSLCVGVKGFLSKIVDVMKKETGASTFRFWLSRAIESFLRGTYSSADQEFLLRRNLLQHVVGNIINSHARNKEVLQSSFDLLGELVRFNKNAFRELNSHLNTVARQKKLLSLMGASLIDSNMFIRSLILSYESFMSSNDPDLRSFAEKHCAVLAHVAQSKIRLEYLRKLLNLINIHNLTQENVSCLNTALVILMYAFKKGELQRYLEALATNQDGCSLTADNQSELMDNLSDLSSFWQDHYLQKDKDCSILEKSSRICFDEWKNIVALLTADDPQDPHTIAFYQVPALSSSRSS